MVVNWEECLTQYSQGKTGLLSTIISDLFCLYLVSSLNYILSPQRHFAMMEKKKQNKREGFPGGAVVESPPANAGDTGSCPGPGRSYMLRSG